MVAIYILFTAVIYYISFIAENYSLIPSPYIDTHKSYGNCKQINQGRKNNPTFLKTVLPIFSEVDS